jgi:hypothetical protein
MKRKTKKIIKATIIAVLLYSTLMFLATWGFKGTPFDFLFYWALTLAIVAITGVTGFLIGVIVTIIRKK